MPAPQPTNTVEVLAFPAYGSELKIDTLARRPSFEGVHFRYLKRNQESKAKAPSRQDTMNSKDSNPYISSKVAIIASRDEPASETI